MNPALLQCSSRFAAVLAFTLVAGLGTIPARAQILTPVDVLGLSTIFPTKPDPGGVPPYITATLNTTNGYTVGGISYPIELTLSATGLTAGEFISSLAFNFGPPGNSLYSPQDLSFTAGTNTTGFVLGKNDPNAPKNNYSLMQDGDGRYSVEVDFPTSGSSMFTQGTALQLYVSWSKGTIAPTDLFYTSVSGGGAGTYYMAAHIQNVGTSSSWVGASSYSAIPEAPGAAFWLGAAALCAAGLAKFRRLGSILVTV